MVKFYRKREKAGSEPELVISGSDDKGRVADAIDSINTTDISGSLDSGLGMAQSVVAAWDNYRVLAFTDSSANMQNINCEVVDLSVEGDNGAIQSLSHTISANGIVKVMARVDNYGKNNLNTDVNLYIGSKLYDIQSVTAKSGESSVVYFKDIPMSKFNTALSGDTPYLMAELNSKDMLSGDNTVYDILNDENNEKILLVTDKNTFLEKALRLLGNKTVDKTSPKDMEAVDKDEYSLVVYDGVLPDELPDTGNVIFINPSVAKETKEWQHEIFKLPENKEQNNKKGKASLIRTVKCDVTKYIEDYSFSCLNVTKFNTPRWASGFFNTEDKLSAGYIGNYNGRMVAVIGFDLHNTDFPLQTEFPVFMYNLLRKTMSTKITEKIVYSAGETVSIQKKGNAEKAVVTKPDGTKDTYSLESGMAVFSGTSNAGLYYIEEGDDEMYFTVSFPEDESNISEKAVVTFDKNSKTEVNKKVSTSVSKKMVVIPVLAVLLILLMVEWHIYRKKL